MAAASFSLLLSKVRSIFIKLEKSPSGFLCWYPFPNFTTLTRGLCFVETLYEGVHKKLGRSWLLMVVYPPQYVESGVSGVCVGFPLVL